MAQNTVLAAGSTAATSSDVAVAAGSIVTIGVFSAGSIPWGVELPVMIDTPGADMEVDRLSVRNPAIVLSGPGTFRVVRSALSGGQSIGVFSET